MSLDPKAMTAMSKNLTQLLRHGAKDEGLFMNSNGYVYVNDMMALPRFQHRLTLDLLHEIVASDRKQRFALLEVEEAGVKRLMIKANQGHSLDVVKDEELRPIENAAEFPCVIHGTNRAAWEIIQKEGLNRMGRLHIHMAQALPGANEVISGARTNSTVIIHIDLAKALADNIPFFVSKNGVILSEGPIPPQYFREVSLRTGSRIRQVP